MRWETTDTFKVWTRWFAWYPVHIGDHQWVWWDYVERKRRMYGYDPVWDYRPYVENAATQ